MFFGLTKKQSTSPQREEFPVYNSNSKSVWLALLFLFSQTANAQVDEVATEQVIAELISQLADDQYAVRESATLRLEAMAATAAKQLNQSLEGADAEAQIRIQRVLDSVDVDSDNKLTSHEKEFFAEFKSADARQRLVRLRSAAAMPSPELFFRQAEAAELLAAEKIAEEKNAREDDQEEPDGSGVNDGTVGFKPPPEQFESPVMVSLLDENQGLFMSMLSLAIVREDWENVDLIVSHPITQKYAPVVAIQRQRSLGLSKEYATESLEKIRKAAEQQTVVSQRQVRSLVGLLRLQNRFEEAGVAIDCVAASAERRQLRKDVLFQQGNLQEIYRRTQLAETDRLHIAASEVQTIFLHRLLGDDAAVEAAVDELRQAHEAAVDAGKESVAKALAGKLRLIGLVTVDWPLVESNLDPNQVDENFQLLLVTQRTDAAFRLLGVGETFALRKKWFDEKLVQLQAKQKKLIKSKGKRSDEFSKLNVDIGHLNDQLIGVAMELARRGLTAEAQLYYQLMLGGDPQEDFQLDLKSRVSQPLLRAAIEQTLFALLANCDQKSYWEIAESFLGDGGTKRPIRIQFGVGVENNRIAQRWADATRKDFDDPLLHEKTAAAIVNSPYVDQEEIDFDLDFEIARYRTQSRFEQSGAVEYTISQILEMHGREKEAMEFLQQSVDLGNASAGSAMGQRAVLRSEHRTLIDSWLPQYKRYRYGDSSVHAERAIRKLMQDTKDPQVLQRLQTKLAQAGWGSLSLWHGSRHWVSSSISKLRWREQLHLADYYLKSVNYGLNGEPYAAGEPGGSQQLDLAEALSTTNSSNIGEGANAYVAHVFEALSLDNVNSQSMTAWLNQVLKMNYARSKAMIEKGELERAANLLVRCVKFCPGDVTASEDTVAALSDAGAAEQANRVYGEIEKYFIDNLSRYPDSASYRNNFAWLSACANRDLDSALRHAKLAVKLKPDVSSYLDTLAEIEFLLGRSEAAFKLSQRCVELSPSRVYYWKQRERFRNAMEN